MDVSSDIRFLAGKPWRRRHHGHPPGFDYSECDDYLCPIYIYVDGRQLAFLIDAMVTGMSCADYLPEDGARMLAEVIADALNRAVNDPEWRGRNLRYLSEGIAF
jgi:hypothetical protein